jgi:poly-gamma-glutamate synthesis protein (capsule biosynthesis protein)
MQIINKKSLNFLLSIILVLFSGCTPLWGSPENVDAGLVWTETPTPFQPYDTQLTHQVLPTVPTRATNLSITQVPIGGDEHKIWISAAIPSSIRDKITGTDLRIVDDKTTANYQLDVQTFDTNPSIKWVYVLVTPFSTIIDNVQWSDLTNTWKGENNGPLAGKPIWLDPETLSALSSVLGPPAAGNINVGGYDSILDSAWNDQPSWGIVPFEDLEPRWKVIRIDGISPVSNDFELESYQLKVNFSFDDSGSPPELKLAESNRDAGRLTTLVMTGVTALVRATAGKMERNGVLYPGKDIRTWLLSADLTHISNEIPFSENCPYPDPNQKSLVFCSDPKYLALLIDVGTDIVELTGNHFQDWGSDATLKTLQMYNLEGWVYYRGGSDLADAQSPKMITHNENKFAFIGCNPAGPPNAWATNYQPGASPCDFEWMAGEISRLKNEGFLPIVTFQYIESYSVHPLPKQIDDFRRMVDAGAVLVSGSQAHLPQTMEFYAGSFIHYGLGNLFFDQMDYPVVGTRREFIDRHIFYEGKYISTELLTAMLEDYSRPRPMTNEERSTFLQEIFSASGW